MQKKGRKLIYILLVIAVLIAIGIPFGKGWLYGVLEKQLRTQLDDLPAEYDSLYSDWHRSVIVIEGLSLAEDRSDTVCAATTGLSIGELRIQGFDILPYLLKNTLSFERVILNHATITQGTRQPQAPSRKTAPFRALQIGEIRLNDFRLLYADSGSCRYSTQVRSAAAVVHSLSIRSTDHDKHYKASRIVLQHTDLHLEDSLYRIGITRIDYDQREKSLTIDTIRIKPLLTRLAFARRSGYERDRIDGVVPYVRLRGLDIGYGDSTDVSVTSLRTQGFVKFFRDKRFPHTNLTKPLPHALVQQLPFNLRIDSLHIDKSYIEYEEHPEKASYSGKIFFDDLAGVITNISSHPQTDDASMRVQASARFLGASRINLKAALSLSEQASTVEGMLEGLELDKLNALVEPMAAMKIESGFLHRLSFHFYFNDFRADGSVKLNYENLRIISLRRKDDKSEDDKKDNIQTFILNTFVIKRNMTTDLPEDKRTGVIVNERDKTRSIFNYWWKSVFAGIKSAMNITDNGG